MSKCVAYMLQPYGYNFLFRLHIDKLVILTPMWAVPGNSMFQSKLPELLSSFIWDKEWKFWSENYCVFWNFTFKECNIDSSDCNCGFKNATKENLDTSGCDIFVASGRMWIFVSLCPVVKFGRRMNKMASPPPPWWSWSSSTAVNTKQTLQGVALSYTEFVCLLFLLL